MPKGDRVCPIHGLLPCNCFQGGWIPEHNLQLGQTYCYKHGIRYPLLYGQKCYLCELENKYNQRSKAMGKLDSMWFFEKISLGLSIVNGILVAMADKKFTIQEIVNLLNIVLMSIAPDLKITLDDVVISFREDGGLRIDLSAKLTERLSVGF